MTTKKTLGIKLHRLLGIWKK